MDSANPSLLARIEELQARIAFLQANVQATQGAGLNRAFSQIGGGTAPTAVTAGMTLNYAAVVLPVQESGIFDVSITMAWSGATTADTGTFSMTSQTSAAAIVLASATAVGTPANSVFVSSAAGGITVSSGGGGSISQWSIPLKAVTTVLQGEIPWRGFVQNRQDSGSAAATPFTRGNNVVFLFALNSTNGWTLAAPQISAVELAA